MTCVDTSIFFMSVQYFFTQMYHICQVLDVEVVSLSILNNAVSNVPVQAFVWIHVVN